jgi:predicted HTH transcriptional regulator
MSLRRLLAQLARGEDDRLMHVEAVHTATSLAADLAAFANSEGGMIYVGVGAGGALPGLPRSDLARVYQLIRFAALQHVRSPLSVTIRHIRLPGERVVVAVGVPRGPDRPHFDRSGVIWRRDGADKRRVTSKAALFELLEGDGPLAPEAWEIKPTTVPKTVPKTDLKLMALLKAHPTATMSELAERLALSRRGVKWQLDKLKAQGRLRRIGPIRGGRWEVLE